MRTHQKTNAPKTAIGYVRVSTQEQATDEVSLDAQRDRLRTYCKLNVIKLIDIKADEGYSGSHIDRPGLQAALQMLRRGRANTFLVAKLDRLSRSLRNVCTLVDELFSEEQNHLLSLCGMVNTHSAARRMVHSERPAKPFSLAEVSLTEIAVCWRYYPSFETARAELERCCAVPAMSKNAA